jgi:hypothetical protein
MKINELPSGVQQPELILRYLESIFKSSIWKECLREQGIKTIFITVHRPQVNLLDRSEIQVSFHTHTHTQKP